MRTGYGKDQFVNGVQGAVPQGTVTVDIVQ